MAAPCADEQDDEPAVYSRVLSSDERAMKMILRLRRCALNALPCGAHYESVDSDWRPFFNRTDDVAVRFQRTCLAYGIEIVAAETDLLYGGPYITVFYIHCAPGFDKSDEYLAAYKRALSQISAWRRVMADNAKLSNDILDGKISIPDSKPYEPEWRPRGCPFYWADKPPVAK